MMSSASYHSLNNDCCTLKLVNLSAVSKQTKKEVTYTQKGGVI